MKKTGIKVWVLTGDKIETAMNIGVAAGLLDNNMDEHIIEETNYHELKDSLDVMKESIKAMKKNNKQAIIVAGASLSIIDNNDNLRDIFL